MKKSIIILVLILVSCGSKKTTTSVTTSKATSAETKYVSLPIETNYSVGLECDSLGRVKPIDYLKSSGLNRGSVDIKDNRLNVRLLTGQSVYNSLKTTSDTSIEDKEEVVRYKVSPWHWFFHLLAGVFIFLLIKLGGLNPLNWIKIIKFW
jgi:hypothetical protein